MFANPRSITLTTDFGSKDYYIPAMIGTIRSISPHADIHHLSHEISSQNILEAAFVLKNSYRWFPKNTIHVCVVDPEVGSNRDAVIVIHNGFYFIAPDNGILTLTLNTIHPDEIYSIIDSPYLPETISPVFHGRDIFVPVAAWLSKGVPVHLLGRKKTELVDLRWGAPYQDREKIIGQIIHIDHFGNCISNIDAHLLKTWAGNLDIRVSLPGWEPLELSQTYSNVEAGDPVALIGSSGMLEIGVYQSNASTLYELKHGTQLIVHKQT